jgi:hypothetical protein
MLGGKTVMAWW